MFYAADVVSMEQSTYQECDMSMLILAFENTVRDIVAWLRSGGHDVLFAAEACLARRISAGWKMPRQSDPIACELLLFIQVTLEFVGQLWCQLL